MAFFSLRLDLAKEVNRHFLENDYGDLSFFSVILNRPLQKRERTGKEYGCFPFV